MLAGKTPAGCSTPGNVSAPPSQRSGRLPPERWIDLGWDAVGDSDAECPAPQSYEFWHALKTLGVKTQFVVYPGEGHAIRKPEHVQDLLERTIAWFGDNLSPKAAAR